MNSYIFTDEDYGKVLDNIVVGCVDVAITYGNLVLLAKRDSAPIRNEWWILGGRIFVGENLQQTAQRGMERELGLRIEDNERFIEIGTFNLQWQTRREPPSENGCHHLLVAHMLEIGADEKKFIDTQLMTRKQAMAWFEISADNEFLPELNNIMVALKATRVNGE